MRATNILLVLVVGVTVSARRLQAMTEKNPEQRFTMLPAVHSSSTKPSCSYLAAPICPIHLPDLFMQTGDSQAGPSHAKKLSETMPYQEAVSVTVHGLDQSAEADEGFTQQITPEEVEVSAGTYGDVSRFIQTLAGVVSDNDQRNDFLVRGGDPSENLFVIDNIEVPSINQLALSDTTGGFVSMVDQEAVQQIALHTDAYDDRFDQRLSSVVEISTRRTAPFVHHAVSELGIAGLGGSIAKPFGKDGSLFVSARMGILQYFTNDIGMNGVPHYKNAFVRAQGSNGPADSWWGMSLSGIDSIQIRPSITDGEETNPYDIDYKGWRNTTGINWQHIFSVKSLGVMSVAHAAQSQSIVDNGQVQNATVYGERTSDQITTTKYDWVIQPARPLTFTAGGRASVDQLSYTVAQPIGLQNPYSANSEPLDVGAFTRRFSPVTSAGYAQAMFALGRSSTLVLGERTEQWALGGNAGTTSKVTFSVPIIGKLLHLGYSEYEQLPATLYMLAFNNIRSLKPIRSNQFTTGIVLADNPRTRLSVEAYDKRYIDYPVAANYPQLSLANVADTFGQAFLMFPMVGKGTGVTHGVELTAQAHATSTLTLVGTLVYARAWYSGLDGVLRRGNYDIPFQMNLTGIWRTPHHFNLSWRYSQTSGVPYTPDDMTLSYAQNRDVYNLSQVNAARAPAYHRLDFRLERSYQTGLGTLTWHAGLNNALNNHNFYAYEWLHEKGGVSEQTQMPIFPDGGLKLSF